jgi:hypothetical protein
VPFCKPSPLKVGKACLQLRIFHTFSVGRTRNNRKGCRYIGKRDETFSVKPSAFRES